MLNIFLLRFTLYLYYNFNMETSLGIRLLALLKYRGYSQTSFAKHLNIPVSTLNSYIKNVHEPPAFLLKIFCKELNCTIDYFYDMPTQPRQIYLDAPKKAMINTHLIAKELHVEDELIIAWFKNQIDLHPKDEAIIKRLMDYDDNLVSLADTNSFVANRIYWEVDIEYISTKLQQLSRDELEDVEKYIDFIISKRKS